MEEPSGFETPPLAEPDEQREQRRAGLLILSPRAVRWLALLIVANLIVLVLLGLALYWTGHALATRPTAAMPVTVVVTATPTPTTAAPLPGAPPIGSGGAIAFVQRRNGNADIYAINQATHEVVRLTSDPAEERDPAWSPDGQMLAFASNRGHNWDIYLLDLEGGALIRLTRDPGFDGGPSWSPDGERIAFESYRDGNLDLYVMDTDGRNVRRLTTDPAPDHSPAWSPDGRMIAYVSYRNGNQDVYLQILEGAGAGTEVNVTQNPDADESDPSWSPDGSRLAYTINRAGYSTVQVSLLEWHGDPISPTLTLSSMDLFGSGAAPTWAPDGQELVTVYQRGVRSYLISSSLYGWGLSQEVYSADALLAAPTWSALPLSARAIVSARAVEPASDPPLYTEFVQPSPLTGPPYRLVYLENVNGADDQVQLTDRVDDSFIALRQRVLEESGWDYLATLGGATRSLDYVPPSGQPRMSWNVCGRAVELDQTPYTSSEPTIVLVREDVGSETYWRVFLRAARQDGSMGEPLRVAPWDLNARQRGGVAGAQGGELLATIPSGYYVDFTALAADYGWQRTSALYRWRYYWPDIRWWVFQKTDDLTWWQCMLELYEQSEVELTFGPLPSDALSGAMPLWMAQPLYGSGDFELGAHVHDTGLPDSELMHYAGMTWVKIQVRYGANEDEVLGAMRIAHSRGFHVLLGLLGSPDLVTQPNFERDFAAWAARLADLGADGIEVWNEPNIDREWQRGSISPVAYTRLLCAVYAAVHEVSPDTLVISAAPAPTGAFGGNCTRNGCDDVPFLQQMYAAGAAQCMDYLGAHYNSGATAPTATSGHPWDSGDHHHSWYFLPQLQLYFDIFGGTRRIFFTELGYASQEGVPTFPGQFAWARGIDNSEQAAWLAQAAQLSVQSGIVRGMIVWNWDMEGGGSDPQDGYAIVRPGGVCPACDALHEVLGTRRP